MSRRNNPIDHSPYDAVSFDAGAFEDAIQAHGIKLVHYRAMRCPVGMVDQYSERRPHKDHSGCQGGFLYFEAGECTSLFSGNSTNSKMADVGLLDGSTVSVTFPKFYDGTEQEILLATFDRIYLKENKVPVINWQLFEYNQAGYNKMQYPVEHVEHLVDSNGVQYKLGVDFEVADGQIKWIGKTPGMDLETNKGLVCSIRYTYLPFWYVKNLMHEVRVIQIEDPLGNRAIERMPFAAMLQREYVFELEDKEPSSPTLKEKAPAALRQMKGPGNLFYAPK